MLERPISHSITGLDLNSMSNLQDILPVIDAYKNAQRGVYLDSPVLEKNSISATLDTDDMSADEIVEAFDEKKWADVSVYKKNGELRKDLVEVYNARTFRIVKDRYGIELKDVDQSTGLFINPLTKENKDLEMIHGRGILGKYGINDAVDLCVETVDPDGVKRVLTMRRPRDLNKPIAVPGGVVDYKTFDTQEELKDAASREGFEEMGLRLSEEVKIEKVGSYLVADPRNTALSFMGTTVFKAKVSWEQAQKILQDWEKYKVEVLNKSPEDIEAEGGEFRPVSGSENILKLGDKNPMLPFFASHKYIVGESIKNPR